MQSRSILVFAVAMAVAACRPAEPPPDEPGPRRGRGVDAPTRAMMEEAAEEFDALRSGFVEWYFETHPVRASELGVHDHDHRLPALTRTGIQERIDGLLRWLVDLENVSFDLTEGEDRYDYAALEYGIRSELLTLEESRDWANDPRTYTGVLARGLASVAEREHAPLADRVEALNSRMAAGRTMLEAVRPNLRRPPRLWTEMAIADARGLVEYLEGDLPAMLLAQAGGGDLPANGLTEAPALASALEAHAAWLQSELLPRSTGTYRLGRYLLQRKLLYSEHISLELEELERLNADAIAELRRRVEDAAREIDPARTSREIMDSIGRLHPTAEELVPTAREMMVAARDWVVASGVVTVPRDDLPTVRDSPPYARDAFTSLDARGPFEDGPLDAYYNITNVLPDWNESLREEHLSQFSRSGLMASTLHETFPGRWVQRQYARDLPPLRRLFSPASVAGGWSHYATGMAIDMGVSNDPAVRLSYLQRALQRHARWYAVIRLHAAEEPLDDVVAAFMEIAYFQEFPARREVVRATYEPTYLGDALGRMQIVALREDYREYVEARGEEFSLADFHDRLLKLGLPFPLAREALMPREPGRRSAR